MTRAPRRRTTAPVLSAIGTVVSTVVASVLAPTAALAAGPTRVAAGSVRVTVSDVRPLTPARSNAAKPVTFTLTLHNGTSQTLRDVTVTAARGDPIGSGTRLQEVLAHPGAADTNPLPIPTVSGRPVRVTLAPGHDAQVAYRTAAGIAQGAPLCECADAVYPILFTASYDTPAGPTRVGTAQTYLPVFGLTAPAKVRVSWLWPLLDRPHRLLSATGQDNVFADDDLTNEVSSGGRLDRLLSVVERVAASVPLTLVVDPDLLDELQVMSTGHYVIRPQGATTTVPGAGASAAADWLRRLSAVLAAHRNLEVDLTAPADPDVESLTQHTLTWQQTPNAAAQQRIEAALGGFPTRDDLSWPVAGSVSAPTLRALHHAGVSTVVLDAGNLRGRTPSSDIAFSPLHTAGFLGRAAVVDPQTDALAGSALQVDGHGIPAIPALVSRIAVHAVEAPTAAHYVVIAPPRFLDPDVDSAARAIRATATSYWSTPLTVGAAVRTIPWTDRGTLHPAASPPGLPGAVLATAETVRQRLPDLQALFEIERKGSVDASVATRLLGPLPLAVQRAESSSWRYSPGSGAAAAAHDVAAQVDHWIDGVSVVKPATGTYTLTSTSAPLPVTLANSLAVPVSVVLDVHARDGLPGLSTDPGSTIVLGAHSTQQVKVTVHLERTGRLPVDVVLRTPTGLPLGQTLPLTIHGTAIGAIGTAITVVAAVVLALAMVLQAVRRLRARRRSVREELVPPTPVGIG